MTGHRSTVEGRRLFLGEEATTAMTRLSFPWADTTLRSTLYHRSRPVIF